MGGVGTMLNGKLRLRGWGGVGAMAAACALTAALLPATLHHTPDSPGKSGGTHTAQGRQAAATADCKDPEASLRPSSADGPAVDRIKKRGKLIAGVDQNSYRWGYRNPADGELQGFDIDLVRAIAKEILGDPKAVIFRAIPTNQRIPLLKAHKLDVVVRTMTINCDRLKDVAFSTEYFRAGQQVLAPKNSGIKGFDDSLRGKRVCKAAGSTAESALDPKQGGDSHGARLITVANQLDCLVRLQLGQADAIITDNALAAGQAAQDPSLELVGDRFTDEPYGVAMNKDDTDLVRRVDKVLADYRKGGGDSPWMQSYRKWLKADLPGLDGPPAPKYKD